MGLAWRASRPNTVAAIGLTLVAGTTQRFCVCVNPEAKGRDEIVWANLVAYLTGRIDGSDAWP